MGPPPFGDGNAKLCGCSARRNPSFNGATAFRRWKLETTEITRIRILRLQWGHRLSAMETFQTVADLDKQARLQWGHRLSAMETSTFKIVVGCVVIASMGPPPFGDGNYHHMASSMSVMTCFNGATAFRRWKHLIALDENLGTHHASMGPPPFGDGNMASRATARPRR